MPSSDSHPRDLSTHVLPPEIPGSKPTGWIERDNHEVPDRVDPGADTESLGDTDPAASPAVQAREAGYIQHYELIRELGRGGMGMVHLARDLRLGRLVAIKMLTRPGYHQERFLQEARATARCRHENIVVIHDVGVHDGQPYLVFEYLRGQTLRQWMTTRLGGTIEAQDTSGSLLSIPAQISPARAVELIVPVVRALVRAHGMGIIHRDLKPANIMLSDEGITKVLDFGVAKISGAREDIGSELGPIAGEYQELTARGMRLGTLPYMSPEQLAGDVVDHRSDIWAVGIILYELVTGAHPLAPLSPLKIQLMADVETPMPSVREHRTDLGGLADVISRCLLKDREYRTATARELLQELEALLPAQLTRARDEEKNPFAGLAAFQETDADRFFGRDHDITSLVSKLRSMPLLAVTGPSGAGKSSLIRAGVIPDFKRSGEGWEAIAIRPGRSPLASLAEALLSLSSASLRSANPSEARGTADGPVHRDAIVARLRAEPGYFAAELRTWARARLRRLVLFVDQFEELYTLGGDAVERALFLACLEAVADDSASPLRLILAVRSDFLDRLIENKRFLAIVNRGLEFLAPLGRGGLREALTRPVESCGYDFEHPDMVEQILDELATARGVLPLLQFTAAKLWARRDRQQRLITRASMRELGGVAGALAAHADTVLAAMTAGDTRIARGILLRLVTPERTRALITLEELRQLGPTSEDMDRVLGRLLEARLLAIDSRDGSFHGASDGDSLVEIAHESLIDTWPLLARWLVESDEDQMFLARLRSAAREWQKNGRAAGLLWRDEIALDAQRWYQRYRAAPREELDALERAYLEAVVSRVERARRQRQRSMAGAITALALIALTVSYLAVRARSAAADARQQAANAERAAEQARERAIEREREAARARDAIRVAAAGTLLEDPTTALALLREIETGELPPSWSALATSVLSSGVADAVLRNSAEDVIAGAFSPDGKYIAMALGDGAVRVRNIDGADTPLLLRGHEGTVASVAFSPDGKLVASGSFDRTVRLWNADGTGEARTLRGHEAAVLAVAFSPDARLVASASMDGTVRIWNVDGSGIRAVLRGHEDGIRAVAFSPDGARVASGSFDQTVRLWNIDGSGRPRVFGGHADAVADVVFSPDGSRLASASLDGMVRVWNTDGRDTPRVLPGHEDRARSIAFSPDGMLIASGSYDETVRVWNVDGHGEPRILRGHSSLVYEVAFSADGTRLTSASLDGTVRVWKEPLKDRFPVLHVAPGHEGELEHVAVGPDGRRIASAWQNTVRLSDLESIDHPLALPGHQRAVSCIGFSPDGTHVASGSKDGTVRVWSYDSSHEPRVLRGHEDGVGCVAFSPDGTRIASASQDGTVRIWNADGSSTPLVLHGHEDEVVSVAFSPDGSRVASASVDRTVRVWSADGTGTPLVLRGHDLTVTDVVFSPDGRRIASGSFDKTVRVWSSDGSGAPLVLRDHEHVLFRVAFSPDGKLIASGSWGGTIQVWNSDGSGPSLVLRGHTDGVTSLRFGSDGMHLISGSLDGTVRTWNVIMAIQPTDPRLWTATTYCLTVDLRQQLLGMSEDMARQGEELCRRRVARAR